MANRFAGLDPTWAHLPTPAPAPAAGASHYCSSPAWLRGPAAAFENEALTSALRASMAPAPAHAATAAASSLSSPATPSSSTSSASELLSSGGGGGQDAPAPASTKPGGGLPTRARALAGPKGGRVAKRKPRPSRRAQTTYITADPADFRRMVQEITGLPVPGPSSSSACSFPTAASGSDAGTGVAAPASWTPAPACVLPTLDTSAFLLERAAPPATAPAPAPEDKSTGGGGYASSAVAAAGDEDSSSVLLELEALVRAPAGAIGFPTLDLESWGII